MMKDQETSITSKTANASKQFGGGELGEYHKNTINIKSNASSKKLTEVASMS